MFKNSIENSCSIIDIQPLRDGISKCKCKVFYLGANGGNTYINEEVAKQLAASLPGKPIVGYYNEVKQQFEGHKSEVSIDITNGQVTLNKIYHTVPFGYVSETDDVYFQDFEENGEIKRYVICSGYLWTDRYPQAIEILSDTQSMELDPKKTKGFWAKMDKTDEEIYILTEGSISALCALGEGHHPVFEGSEFIPYFDEGNFNSEYELTDSLKQMKEQVSYIMKNNKGGTQTMVIEEKLVTSDFEKDEEKLKDEKKPENGENKEPKAPEDKKEDKEPKGKEEDKEKKEDFACGKDDKKKEDFEDKTSEDSKKKPEDEKKKEEETPKEDKKAPKEENKSAEEDKKKKEEFEALKSDMKKISESYEKLLSDFEKISAELNVLKAEKIDYEMNQKKALIEKFSFLDNELLQPVVEHLTEYSLDNLDIKLSALAFKSGLSATDEFEIKTPIKTPKKNMPEWFRASKESK